MNTGEIGQVDEAGVPRLQRYLHTGAQAMTAESFKAAIVGKVAAHNAGVATQTR